LKIKLIKYIFIMKFTAIAALIGATAAAQDDTTAVWNLRSVNDHRDDQKLQQDFGDHATSQANARPPLRSHMMTLDEEAENSVAERNHGGSRPHHGKKNKNAKKSRRHHNAPAAEEEDTAAASNNGDEQAEGADDVPATRQPRRRGGRKPRHHNKKPRGGRGGRA
jgi:hypothetical protein